MASGAVSILCSKSADRVQPEKTLHQTGQKQSNRVKSHRTISEYDFSGTRPDFQCQREQVLRSHGDLLFIPGIAIPELLEISVERQKAGRHDFATFDGERLIAQRRIKVLSNQRQVSDAMEQTLPICNAFSVYVGKRPVGFPLLGHYVLYAQPIRQRQQLLLRRPLSKLQRFQNCTHFAGIPPFVLRTETPALLEFRVAGPILSFSRQVQQFGTQGIWLGCLLLG